MGSLAEIQVLPFDHSRLGEVVSLLLDAQQEWKGAENSESLADRIAGPGREGWIALSKGELAGFAAWTPEPNSYSPSPTSDYQSAHLSALYVAPLFQRRGIGGRLHDCICDQARSKQMRSIRLWTPHSANSRGFYEHIGYQDSGRRITYAGVVRVEYRRLL